MTEFKVGDKIVIGKNSIDVTPGTSFIVVEKLKVSGVWIDCNAKEVDVKYVGKGYVNSYADFKLAEEEKVNKRFAVGDKVISVKDTPAIPEGFIGYVVDIQGSPWPYTVTSDKGDNQAFNEDELELLSAGKKEEPLADYLVDMFSKPDIELEKSVEKLSTLLEAEYTGGSSSYYKVEVTHPTTSDAPYQAECNDVIEALGLTFTEGNIFKAIWRIAADRQGKKKKGNNSVYDAEKVVFFAERLLVQEKSKEGK